MNIPLKKIQYFKDFINNASKLQNNEGNNIFMIISAIESYYEFIAEALIPSSSRSKTQHKLLLELKELELVSFDEFKIMDETRKLKNDLTHRLDFLPDENTYHNFNNNCNIENIKKPNDAKNQDELLQSLTYSLISGFKIIDKKLFLAVSKELED